MKADAGTTLACGPCLTCETELPTVFLEWIMNPNHGKTLTTGLRMSEHTASPTLDLELPAQTKAQLDELVRRGRFPNHATAVVAAVERLFAEEQPPEQTRHTAFRRLCGALRLGTSRASLQQAERDRLDWESEQR